MIAHRKQTVEHQDEWRACGGEVGRMVRRLRWRRRSQRASKAALMVLVVLAPVSLAYWTTVESFLTSQIELRVASAPCTYYEDEMLAYYSEKSRSDLPPQLWEHIATCSACSKDLIFYGGIAASKVRHQGAVPPSAHVHRSTESAVSLTELWAEGTLAVHR
jgi:hypothetical protein